MNEEQQDQLTKFLALFAWMLHEGSASREQAELVLQVAASCMIATVFQVGKDHPEADAIGEFARRVIRTALQMQYEPKAASSRQLQA